ncbi:O-antigen ligase family protein [uncultured Flavobacterium sp.]|uniref:O-antigen ligase family protein n=1 Tax=uncultured Flavobacterium sp. TaxID=165435 RepID=UPI0030EC138A|tara:strand:- start:22035 stop:23339 length:1305 start_codon:yes stop_codon:yes gene_type:complete
MNISENNFNKIFNIFLFLIASTMIFRKPCTWIIIGFVLFNLGFIKKLKLTRLAILLGLVIASPLLLEILLFWNNDSFGEGLKSMEKSISLLLFPLFILGNYKRVQFIKLLQFYSYTTTAIVLFFFIRFIVVFPDLIDKYLGGTDLWEMGYSFSNSIGIHAPALNMHLAFVAIISMYFVVYAFRKKENLAYKLLRVLVFALSFFFVLFVNTRMALFNVIAGIIIIFFYEVIRNYNFKKVAVIITLGAILLGGILFLFVKNNPYMKEKYNTVTFAYMDKVGKLDEIENPEAKVFNSFVTRVSIWKSAWELSLDHLPFGVGASDGKPELFKYYKQSNQHFLAKYEFPTHNQFLDFLLKFGVLGPVVVFLYIFTIGYLGYDLKNAIVIFFFFLFLTSNLTDDFLLRFDGIAFSGFWFSVFGSSWLQEKATVCKERLIA